MGARCSPLLTDLHGPAGARGDLSGLEKGVLGVLFAGKWCQPCDEFIDILKRCYQQVSATSLRLSRVISACCRLCMPRLHARMYGLRGER